MPTMPVLQIALSCKRDQQARIRLRARFAKLFSSKESSLSPEQALRVANVALQIVKSMKSLYAEARPRERDELIREYKLALAAYLEDSLAR
jgi:hypothetical protein